MKDFEFVDPRQTPFVEPTSRGELPHLYKEGGTYFVTFRLWDAVIPKSPRPNTTRKRESDPQEIAESSEAPLRLGSCLLADPKCADLVQSALRHFDGARYHLLAWCVMPNHVHTIFQPLGEQTPSSILHSWKSFTSHQINKALGRTATLWERESFDHLVRSIDHLERFIRYVEENPVAAGLCLRSEDWPWSSAAFKPCGAGVPPAPPASPASEEGAGVPPAPPASPALEERAGGTPAPPASPALEERAGGTPAPQEQEGQR